jgi:Holliday junction DNA helicase RuvB
MEEILKRSSKILGIEVLPGALEEIAKRSRRIPRIANRILKRVRDFAQVESRDKIDTEIATDALKRLEIDPLGLDVVDRRILETLINKFNGGPVGINTIAAATSEEKETIEEIYEPFLLQMGFIARTARGRVVTEQAYKHLGIDLPSDYQNKLI